MTDDADTDDNFVEDTVLVGALLDELLPLARQQYPDYLYRIVADYAAHIYESVSYGDDVSRQLDWLDVLLAKLKEDSHG